MIKDSNGFPIYDFTMYGIKHACVVDYINTERENKNIQYSVKRDAIKLDDWLPSGRVGFIVDDLYARKSMDEIVVMLEYYNVSREDVPSITLKEFVNKTGGTIIHNSGYLFNGPCKHGCGVRMDTNVCGLISYFGHETAKNVCSCRLRQALKDAMTIDDKRRLGIEWHIGTRSGETLSEDQLDILAKFQDIRLFIIQTVKNQLNVLDLGSRHSKHVKIICSDGMHFEEIFYPPHHNTQK